MKGKEKRKWSQYFWIFLFLIGCSEPFNWVETLSKPWMLSEKEISEILPQFQQKFPDFHDRLKAFAVWQVGKPYELFCLGEEAGEDKDPIFRLDVSDCTVHVLTSLASVQSLTWNEAKINLINIHYKPNENGISIPTYKSRWHYTTDRIQDHPSTRNITLGLLPNDQLKTVTITLNKKTDGKTFLDLDWQKPTSIQYISSENLNSKVLQNLPNVAGVAFVRESYFKMGLVVAHEGMVIDQKNIIHASAEYGETVSMDFMEYYFREEGPLFDGVLFYSFHPLTE
ncbi:MAG: N-acetylmuramoyl-L-alanine amidase-like domain-containing protein [Candidatus Neomarinimicrobiota bacterium]|nr:N-acetylmuramoyl-L-alanine amidase-like domain-containing protein [Candidatus Neomarinimicrobiota bacterium]